MQSPFPAHRPAADDNSLIGCTSHDLTDNWSLSLYSQYAFRIQPVRISMLFWVHSFIEPDSFDHKCTVRQYHSDLSDQSALEIRVRIRVRLKPKILEKLHKIWHLRNLMRPTCRRWAIAAPSSGWIDNVVLQSLLLQLDKPPV